MSPKTTHLIDARMRARMFLGLLGAFLLLFAVLLFRLLQIQIFQGEYHHRLSLENMMRLKVIKAPRGRIYDRTGHLLVQNRASYSIVIYPYKVKDREKLFDNLSKLRDRNGNAVFDRKFLEKKYRIARRRRFDPTVLKEDIGVGLASVVEEHALDLPGVDISTEVRREYPYGSMAFHLFGHISEIPEKQFDSLRNVGYLYGDLIGKMGVEKKYEDLFRGRNGQEYVEVNAFGKEMGVLEDMPQMAPVRGHDLHLTIDFDLQKAAEHAFPDSLKGAVVAMDPRNGEILTMLSSPRPDPNLFTYAPRRRSRLWAKVALDPKMPLNNRAIHGTYPPGSTFKMIVTMAAMKDSLITPEERLGPCRGGYKFGRRFFRCWLERGHGMEDMIDAIKHSCDVYFYQLGLRIGIERINHMARHFGFAAATGVDLPGEKIGQLLDREIYNRKFADRGWVWTKGMTLNLSIGQGQIVTPLQLANFISGIANGRFIYKPRVVRKIEYADGRTPKLLGPEILHKLELSDEILQVTRSALLATVGERGGTGGRARVEGVPVAGKTGSSENPQGELTHALFVAYAPADNPEIAISVVVENAGHGGSVAAPIAGKVLKRYFEKYPYSPPMEDSTHAEG